MATLGRLKHLENTFKILIMGDASVGKTSILTRYADSHFANNYVSTIGVDFKMKSIEIDGQKVNLQMWDTAGQERFRTIGPHFYRNAHAAILCFDITDGETYRNVKRWLRDTQENSEEIYCILIGNKCDNDLKRMVPKREAEDWAAEQNIEYYEVSAKIGTNVEMVFDRLARTVHEKKKEKKEEEENLVKLRAKEPKKQGKGNNSKAAKKSRCC